MRPLNRRAYGSIPHLPGSRLGTGEHTINPGQARICTTQAREGDRVWVQSKEDGSNVSIARVEDLLYPLTRSGWTATSSPYEQHHHFHNWVMERHDMFMDLLKDGERLCGEWLMQAHGTRYRITNPNDLFVAFDLFDANNERLLYPDFVDRVVGEVRRPATLVGPLQPGLAMEMLEEDCRRLEPLEGVVYRVEREGRVDFLAKYVRHDKVDGKYLFDDPPIWNWYPQKRAA